MSQPVPEAEKQPSVFAVPAHIASVLIAGGCGVYHSSLVDAVTCERCAVAVIHHIFPPAPQEAPAAEPASGGLVDLATYPPVLEGESGPELTAPAKARPKTQPTE